MSDLTLRVAVLAVVLAAGFLVVWWLQRRNRPYRVPALPSGLVVVTGPNCRWCDRLTAALVRRPGADYRLLDHTEAESGGLAIRSLPTALVIGGDGTIEMRRSGPAAVQDIDVLIHRAQRHWAVE